MGYLYYRINLNPWEYDCIEVFDGLVYELLSGENDISHNPYINYDYIPEKDPEIIKAVEKLRKEEK